MHSIGRNLTANNLMIIWDALLRHSAPRRNSRYTGDRVLATKPRASFDPKSFLAKVGDGRSIGKYHKGQIIFSQGDPADAVFYIQKGKVKVTVVSE